MTEFNDDKCPECIYVSGFPFFFQGWNGKYKRTNIIKNNFPTYRLEPYKLYFLIDIIGVEIYKGEDKKWFFQRDCDLWPLFKSYDDNDSSILSIFWGEFQIEKTDKTMINNFQAEFGIAFFIGMLTQFIISKTGI
uniref:Uncharacterized protein n=1 Tax=viral metagenome TaxID=1070528 RepID=A0A6C0ADT5_9ZZZZ